MSIHEPVRSYPIQESAGGRTATGTTDRDRGFLTTCARLWDSFRYALPRGRSLTDDVWRKRHRAILVLLWLHSVGVFGFAFARGYGLPHALFEGSAVGLPALVATWSTLPRAVRAASASFGLLTASAILVHLSGGYIELHFHFFVMVALMALYQDWVPFLVAIGYVVIHHGVVGVLDPHAVYNHPSAWNHPWRWALVHGFFVTAASIVSLIAWRVNEHQALHDPLTDLPNRVLLHDRLRHALASRGRQDVLMALLFLDLDNFKETNDRLGHAAGDELLVAVAERLRTSVRPSDTVARLGGDEFAIVLEGLTDPADLARAPERILQALRSPFVVHGAQAATTASIGISVDVDGTSSVEELLRNADIAMYAAKRAGKARFEFFEPAMHVAALDRLDLEADLRRAVAAQEFVLHYQPVLSLASERIVGLEALVRWAHPTRGVLGPAEFIKLAEETGLIVAIGGLVLDEACRSAKAWQERYPSATPLTIGVNLSGRQLQDPGLLASVEETLRATGLDPTNLVLEITETVMMQDTDTSIARLEELTRLGVRIAIDDFGTGYSSLSYLRRFPIDILKVDKSFVDGVADDPDAAVLAEAIISFGATLQLSTLAEGIETVDQRDRLRAMGCELGQGFHFAKPLPAAEIDRLLCAGRLPGSDVPAAAALAASG